MNFLNITRDSTMTPHRLSLLITLALALAFGVTACGDDNASPSDDGDNIIDVPDSGTAGTGGAGGRGGSGGDDDDGGTAGTSGDGGSGGDSGDGGSGGDAGDGGGPLIDSGPIETDLPDCEDATNDTQDNLDCWNLGTCTAVTTEHFLGQCGDNCYAPFDNDTRIEGYTGTLPPLN